MIDLNCDVGEGFNDEHVFPYITSANIACGAHAGSPELMLRTIKQAKKHGVAVGAHPGFLDKEGFGRREVEIEEEQLVAILMYQLGAMRTLCEAEGIEMKHVKPHGALYNMAVRREDYARAIVHAVKNVAPRATLIGLSTSSMLTHARKEGLKTANEFFADRMLEADGTLTPRSETKAVIQDEHVAVARTIQAIQDGYVQARTGESVSVQVNTICLHGDSPRVQTFAASLREALKAANIPVGAANL
ncbi:LamB/YcsF family protein [Paenalkalicoccus suaedae]|uniref:LamB/YcsF family protein n=1 Tax=Paenalkalicoccus suaedae TaxID=2592382 RepID=A0A859FHW4_9BACI|nr:5-oxoprolinase subunit PxpA [Paenalkalicoccus suaedae]QKS72428.1 LamB/YcsF family protein [Paenalkalicoccus suaedae]